jgi:hypothetical protein
MRYLFGLTCVLTLSVVGCSEAAGTGGSGGSPGTGGDGGSGGVGGGGSGGDPIIACLPTEDRCENGTTEPHEPCCEQRVPDQANACDGTESTENPATCTATGDTVTHRLTLMEVEDDCNVGYDLDACEGQSCLPNGITPAEGMSGVDNAFAGFAPVVEGVGAKLSNVNKLLSDALCGLTEGRTCDGGDNDGDRCINDDGCAGADARCVLGACLGEISPTEIRFVIDANASEGCANVTVLADGEASAHILNLSDDGCASGTLGTIPLTIFAGYVGSLANTVVRMTVSSAGFSHGQLGATMDADLVWTIVPALLGPGGGWDSAVPLDISASTPLTQDTSAPCNGLSATFVIGGIAE